ncbi:ribonuclease M5 [Fusobacterium necrogenes]|uniref:Ribonuclease M5 n=1 Tax=Fusobacterium necrogenes TaxID=858 RepID=A0A377GX96_9FUSO|nr:ribonuclease M5 [Fusobacterium necrogenes]STO31556.1 ribonuclease M5 [Fusobacterium necrogenes]
MKKMIKEIIVVEGRDDIAAVKSAVDAEVIQVNGFAVRKKENIERIRVAQKNRGVIILTDPDYAGNEIRKYIHKFFPDAKDAYIRRSEGTKDGDIGVENASPESIIKALEKAKCTVEKELQSSFTMTYLMECGLVGGIEASERREKVGGKLGIGYSNGKQFLSKLNRYGITKEEFEKALNSIK